MAEIGGQIQTGKMELCPDSSVNGLARFLQSLQGLEKGSNRHFCLGKVSKLLEDGK